MSSMICRQEERREVVRQHTTLNGLDYLEVGTNRRILTVYFLGKAPVALEPANVVIEGGRRIRDIRVDSVTVRRSELAELDDTMEVVTDREGDFSTYRLRVVTRDEHGTPQRHPSFDPRYDHIDFTFQVDCPSDLDCKPARQCPPAPHDEPVINYLAKDYASFRQLILDRLSLIMPEWQERHVPDIGIALVEVLAYVGDSLSYYQDAVATEAYLDTARQRISVRRHARLVDYTLHEGCNARTWVCISTDSTFDVPADAYFITNVPGLPSIVKDEDLRTQPAGGYYGFEPVAGAATRVYRGQHEIHFYTWGNQECCLPAGTREATLIGQWIDDAVPDPEEPCEPPPPTVPTVTAPGTTPAKGTAPAATGKTPSDGEVPAVVQELHLRPGDVLIFEETIGPKTGAPADADPHRRHAVRLTRVWSVRDPLDPERPLTGVRWAEEDALPFPLCLSAMGPAPACEILDGISVARGNLILVDHGLSVDEELDPVPVKDTIESCDCTGSVTDVVRVPGRYRPLLDQAPLTFSEPLSPKVPATRMLAQDPRRARPHVLLTATSREGASAEWWPQRDLLNSHNPDRHFVVEIESTGRARLRFGDDELGQRPDAGTAFHAAYRVGNGPVGNVGAGAVAHLVTRMTSISGATIQVRNPMAARGGTVAESMAEAKLYAPHAFRQRLERAITAEDYAAIVEREFKGSVQRAAATLRWNGRWQEVLVAVDPLGVEQADPALLDRIARRLHRYRRIGHDVLVRPARRVPLDIELLVCVLPGYLRAHVKQALLDVFSHRRAPDGRPGLFHPDRLSFGDGIYLSVLIAAAQAVPGVESVKVTRLNRLYEPANGEIEAGVLPLGPLEIARVDNDPVVPENGRLRLDMRGGR